MSFGEDYEFRKKLEHCDNIYAEVCNVMNDARELSSEYDNKILHSQAITSVIHGIRPERSHREYQDEYEANQIKNMFCCISDKEICDAVYDSFYDSKEQKHLIYVYNNIKDEPRKARVRVLTKMLWYKLIK